MRSELGLLLVEGADGKVCVQCFEDASGLRDSFGELRGAPGDDPSRATMVLLSFGEGGVGFGEVVGAFADELVWF